MAKQIRNRQANTDQKLPDTPHTGCPQSFGKATILDSLFACINSIRQLIFNPLCLIKITKINLQENHYSQN